METKNNPLTRGPKEGKTVSVVGATYRILISGDDTQVQDLMRMLISPRHFML